MSDTEDNDNLKKKGPGRPRKHAIAAKPRRDGIISKPTNILSEPPDHYAFELLYENPMMFKKIFGLFKSYFLANVNILFDVDRVYMYGANDSNEVKIMVEIYCPRMNRYYVLRQHRVTLQTEHISNIFQAIAKETTQLLMESSVREMSHKFNTTFTHDEEDESMYTINLASTGDDNISSIVEILKHEDDYPISFNIPFKYFKRKLTEHSNIGIKKILICQFIDENGAYRIYFECETTDGSITNISPLHNSAKINLISSYEDTEFKAPLFISNLKPWANSCISDKMKLSVDSNRDLIMTAELDHDIDPENKKRIFGTEKCCIRVAVSLAAVDSMF